MLRVALQGKVSGKLLARTWPRTNMTQLGGVSTALVVTLKTRIQVTAATGSIDWLGRMPHMPSLAANARLPSQFVVKCVERQARESSRTVEGA
jgi:hypothetical protein